MAAVGYAEARAESRFPVPVFDLETVPEHDRPRVAAMIPDPRIALAYKHRMVRGWYDFDLLDYCVSKKKNVILAGPTGSSKTTLFRAYSAARQLPFNAVECNGAMDPGIVIGRTGFLPDGTAGWIDGDMLLVHRYGGVNLIDEINMAHQRITAAWHGQLSVMRSISVPENSEVVKAGRGGIPKNGDSRNYPQPTLFGGAYNPRYQGAVRLNEALGNRFPTPFKWDYERSVEEQLCKSSRLLDMAYNLRSLAEIRTPVSTNMLMEFEEHARDLDMGMAEYFFVNHFASEEEGPVSRAIEAHSAAIAAELGLAA
jgi:MoxR-like ATPase